MSREAQFAAILDQLGYSFEAGLKLGGDYAATVRHEGVVYVSGQIPRIDEEVIHPGRVGSEVSLKDARTAAMVSALRCLALVREQVGSLDNIRAILRMTVFVQSADAFTRQSEVANGASQVLYSVFGEAGAHTRTSLGVLRLPKNAPVEIDLIAAVT